MMYNNKLAFAIKVNGKVLREHKDTVYIPFGSEYTILIKNLNSKKAIVNLDIDGSEMLSGGLIIDPGQSIDLERSIINGNLTEGNRFKFIERTAGIEQHRGIKLEDGLIKISYQFEKVYYNPYPYGQIWAASGYTGIRGVAQNMSASGVMRGGMLASSATAKSSNHPGVPVNSVDFSEQSYDSASITSYNDAGITVPGSISNQKFSTASSFPLEDEKHIMVLKLLGETPDNKPVIKAVTVKAKPRCVTCNHQNRANAKFCVECGTSLEVIA